MAKLPYPIKRSAEYAYAIIPARYRYGKVFWETYNFLRKSQWWSKEQLANYQMEQLSILLSHAYKYVPYYHKLFDERELKPKNIQSLSDLKKIPCLTKDDFRESFRRKEIIATNFNWAHLQLTHTSGTTGKPIQFYQNFETRAKEWAFVYHQWSRVGYMPGEKRIELRGAINTRRPICHDPLQNVMRFSPIIEDGEKAKAYLKKMQGFGARYLHGYPGAIGLFASLIKKCGLGVGLKLTAVLFTSEMVIDWERRIVEEVFQCPVFSHYGCTERVVTAAECEKTSNYHCVPEYGISEVDSGTGEIIGTGFINVVNPFIRYRTSDIALNPRYGRCDECGRDYSPIFSSLEGRIEDFLVTSRGSIVSPAIATHPFKDLQTIKNTQIIQRTPEKYVLRVVPLDGINKHELNVEIVSLCVELKKVFGAEAEINIDIVDTIELLSSGKFKWIISDTTRGLSEKGLL